MEHEGFLAAIVAEPDDDHLRLIYADWLEENEQPILAEFIRVQIELARLPEKSRHRKALEYRERAILKTHEKLWLPYQHRRLGVGWKRGFPTNLSFNRGFSYGDEKSLEALAAFPLTEKLEFTDTLRDENSECMPSLPNVRSFTLGAWWGISVHSIRRFGGWETLQRLCLYGSSITNDVLAHLVNLKNLEHLNLNGSNVTDDGLIHLSKLTSLKSLDLSETAVTGRGLSALTALPGLRSLDLRETQIWDYGIAGLIGCSALMVLHFETYSSGHCLTDRDLEPLLRLPSLCSIDPISSSHRLSREFLTALREHVPVRKARFWE